MEISDAEIILRFEQKVRRSRTRSRLALAVAALSLFGCFRKPAPPRLTEVTVGTPIRQDVPVYSQWIGTTVGFIDAEIHSRSEEHTSELQSLRHLVCRL